MEFVLSKYSSQLTDEQIIEDIVSTAKKLNKNYISISDYRKYGKYSQTAIQGHFKTWKNALKIAGLRTERISDELKQITNQMYFDDLIAVAKKINSKTVPYEDYKKFGKYSAEHLIKRFGKWNTCLKKAGLEETGFTKDKITEQQCFEEIERIWTLLGRQPTSTDIVNSNISKYSLDTYKRRFGGWRKTLEAFVKFINNVDEIQYIAKQKKEDIGTKETKSKNNINKVLNTETHVTSRNITTKMRFLVLQRDNFKCCACGASPAKDPAVSLQVDHIIPWSKGGETVMENLQTLCSKCNLGKSKLTEST